MKLLIIISLAFMTSCDWVEKASVTKAIILCNGNGGLDKIRSDVFGAYVVIRCANRARFEIPNDNVYTKIEGL